MSSSAVLKPPTNPEARPAENLAPLLLNDLSAALAAYEQEPGSIQAIEQIRGAARALASAAACLPKRDAQHPFVPQALEAARRLRQSGIQDYAVLPEDRAFLAARPLTQWPNAIAAMLLGAAWQLDNVPPLESLPQWLWADFSAWVFAAPQGFTGVGHADTYAAHILRRLEELARLVERNTGSVAVRAAGDAFLQGGSGIPLYFARDCLRRHAELRGRIYRRLFGRDSSPYDPVPFPRVGRRLRVGILSRHFGPQTETYSILAQYEHLDPDRFEVILFSIREADTELAGYCRSKAQDFRVLTSDISGQLSALRDANLDVLVFATNVTAVMHEITRLALYRIAPLQVVNNSSCITTGLPEIDLFISGETTEAPEAPAHFSERLGLLPGPAHYFEYNADKQEATTEWTRAALGIPDEALVFVTAANYYKIIPEMQEIWAKLLVDVPGSRLLVHPFNPNWSATYPIKRFCAEFDRVLAKHGVDQDRIVISTMRFPSRTDVPRLMSVGDIYLDTFPFSGVNSLVDPLEAGVPTVVWDGATFRARMAGALLREIGLPELIATSETEYVGLVRDLAASPEKRAALSTRIKSAMARTPMFLDPLAGSDSFGDLLEAAFDEIVAVGLKEFRANRSPLRASAATEPDGFDQLALAKVELRKAPASSKARRAYGNALLEVGNAARASEYLLAAIQSDEANPVLWFDLAQAFRRNGQPKQALESLEASLRLDMKNVAGWTMLAELAEGVGAFDMVEQANSVVEHLRAQSSASQTPSAA